MSKQIGNFYATETKKVLKQADTIYCKVEGDDILISNSYLLFKMNKYEYELIARPVTCRDAGNWTVRRGEVSERVPDLFKLWNDFTEKADSMPCIERTRLYWDNGKMQSLFYVPDTSKTMSFNSLYTSAIAEHWSKGNGNDKFMVAYDCDSEPFAVILPVIINHEVGLQRALRAYYVSDETTELQSEIAQLKELLEQKTMEYECQLRLNRENVQRIRELENELATATPSIS